MSSIISRSVNWYRRRRQRLHLLAELGHSSMIHSTVSFNFHRNIRIGKYVRIQPYCMLGGEGGLTIGDGTIFASHVHILTSTHLYEQDEYLPYNNKDHFRPVTIGKGVWIAYRCSILPGVTIGDGAIVGMAAVVTKDVPPGAIVGGNPAKILKYRQKPDIKAIVESNRYYIKAVVEENLKRR